MGACQAYGMIIITLQGKAEIQTVKKKQVSQPRSVKKNHIFYSYGFDYSERHVKKCVYNCWWLNR